MRAGEDDERKVAEDERRVAEDERKVMGDDSYGRREE